MHASTIWINDYLDPTATEQEQHDLLTMAGFPVEGHETVPIREGVTDTCTEYEMTSNRGDCICHLGLAREVAAISGRSLKLPSPKNKSTGAPTKNSIRVINHQPDRCPLYTARIIRGVAVKPSPDWLADRLRAMGQIPRNNIVDATNFVLFEFGQPTHVFDLAKIAGGEINIRMATKDEPFLPIGEGEKEVRLTEDDLVIADTGAVVAIGGVKGGAQSAVTGSTTDLLLEAATFAPTTVRNSSRRHRISSDSSYRYERGVHPAHIETAAERLVELILELAGGELGEGVVSDGASVPAATTASMRPNRCRLLLGVDIETQTMIDHLERLGFAPSGDDSSITCTVPAHRVDIEREVDLIEEVGRMYGLGNIPIAESIEIKVAPPQPFVEARRAMFGVLAGSGFVESVTHSLVSAAAAQPFLSSGETMLRVDDDRARETPILRPCLMSSLLRVRAYNKDQGVDPLQLFESGATFAQTGDAHREDRCLGLLVDVIDEGQGLRPLRGVVERIATLLRGPATAVELRPSDLHPWLDPRASADVLIDGELRGWIGMIDAKVAIEFGLDHQLAAAELNLDPLFGTYPPDTEVQPLPEFPAIERDISAVVDEGITWGAVLTTIGQTDPALLEDTEYVTTFRGGQIPEGRKSLTMRLRFRAAERTLTHEEVDPQVEQVVGALTETLGAVIRR